jgi:hypothetical protein
LRQGPCRAQDGQDRDGQREAKELACIHGSFSARARQSARGAQAVATDANKTRNRRRQILEYAQFRAELQPPIVLEDGNER